MLEESEDLYSYLQKCFRLAQRLHTEPGWQSDGVYLSSSGKEVVKEDLACVDEDCVEREVVAFLGDSNQILGCVASQLVQRKSERVWAAAAVLNSLEADLELKRRIVSAVTKTPDTTPGQMQVYTSLYPTIFLRRLMCESRERRIYDY